MVRGAGSAHRGLGLEKVVDARPHPGSAGRRAARHGARVLRTRRARVMLSRLRSRRPSPSDRSTSTPRRSCGCAAPGLGLPLRARPAADARRGAPADLPAGDVHRARPRRRRAAWCRSSGPSAATRAGIVVGVVRNFTDRYPEGMARVVILLGDPSRGTGRAGRARVPCASCAALDLAADDGRAGRVVRGVRRARRSRWRAAPRTWTGSPACCVASIDVHPGAAARSTSWSPGINVGAQPYWNAEATMLMHTRGILVMTPDGAMVLTGKQALDYSGGVSAEDNFGIGGYERIMGPNGQAQYWARRPGRGLPHPARATTSTPTWRPGERFPRRAPTADPRRPRRARLSAPRPEQRLPDRGRHLLDGARTPGARSPSTSAR